MARLPAVALPPPTLTESHRPDKMDDDVVAAGCRRVLESTTMAERCYKVAASGNHHAAAIQKQYRKEIFVSIERDPATRNSNNHNKKTTAFILQPR